jgi:PAP2 superfamily
MRTLWRCVPRFQTTAIRSGPLALYAVLALVLAGGCVHQRERAATPSATPPTASPWALPTATMRWNEYACELIARNQIGQFPAARTLAYMNLAINNAIGAAQQQGRTPDGAAAGASAAVLAYIFPKEEQAIAARLSGETAALGSDGPRSEFAAGVELGRAAGAAVIAAAKSDRADLTWSGPAPTGPDKWSSQLQPPRPPLGPRLGEMRPFFLTTGADFRTPGPPASDSPAFRAAVAEVRATSDKRTNEQLRIAQYWEQLSGAFTAGFWNDVTRNAISAHGRGELEAARILAMVHMVAVDAFIACHDTKYMYWVPRPSQVDAGIRLTIGLPNHPSYPSNHGCVSGAIAFILDAQFPDQGGRYSAMARQAGESRIYAGIHYRFDVDDGLVIARKVSARALQVGIPSDRPFAPLGR